MNVPELNVLVLGVGGNVSQGILKALALAKLPCRIVGACVSPQSAGLYLVPKAYISPFANDPNFLDWLIRICRAERIHAIFSGTEQVLSVLAENSAVIQAECGAFPIVSPPEILRLGNDKLATCQWLAQKGFNYPQYALSIDTHSLQALVAQVGFPLLAKPRFGKGSQGIVLVHHQAELEKISTISDYLVQEYLPDAEHEYTSGCFSDRNGQVRGVITFRREINAGTSVYAEAGDYPLVHGEAWRIAQALCPLGPCNVQSRLHQNQAVCFEINLRFSGTTPARAHFGFNDVELALRHYVLGEPASDLPLITHGKFARYWNEVYF
jgi:carbamoyl-phosphate synthase large subunit